MDGTHPLVSLLLITILRATVTSGRLLSKANFNVISCLSEYFNAGTKFYLNKKGRFDKIRGTKPFCRHIKERQ